MSGKGFHHLDVSPGNLMYYNHGNSVVGVLNDLDLATDLSLSGIPNTDRTGTIPFMALQLLEGGPVIHLFRHDAESFIWLFLWVCGCSNGSKREVLVAPYKVWKTLEMFACKEKKEAFLARTGLKEINVSEHHAPNSLFCLFLVTLLQQLLKYVWWDIPTSADRNLQDQKDMALFKAILPKFREVRAELNKRFSPKDWYDDEGLRINIDEYIHDTVHSIVSQRRRGFL